MQIIWAGRIVAESDDVLLLGKEYYFPLHAVKTQYLMKNTSVLHCPDKGYATCYDLVDHDEIFHNAAWEYLHPYPVSANLKGKIGFRHAIFHSNETTQHE